MSALTQAEELVNGDRQKSYGSPLENHARIAKFWSAVLDFEVTAEQVALCMVGTKVARLMQTPDHADSIVDLAGYAGVYERIIAERIIAERTACCQNGGCLRDSGHAGACDS